MSSVLVDSSIWIGHFNSTSPMLVNLIANARVVTHPFIIGELAAGGLPRRSAVLGLLSKLPGVFVADHDNVMAMVEFQRLYGLGLSWIDLHLLASAKLSGVQLLSADKRLNTAAARLGIKH